MRIPQAVSLLALLSASACFSAVITFAAPDTGTGLSSYAEGNFQFTRISGSQACIEIEVFSMGCVGAPGVGDRFDVTRVGGGLFTCTEFDSASQSAPDGMTFIGEVGSVVTQQLVSVPSPAAGNAVFTTYSTAFTAPIDRLRLQVTALGNSYLQLDNFVLTPADAAGIPEPSTFCTLGVGVLAAACLRRRSL